MDSFISFFAAVLIASAGAIPTGPSNIVRQETAEPSAFPLGDACGNEWKYLNFDKDDDTHKSRLQKLHDVICVGELRAVAAHGGYAASKSTGEDDVDEVFETFFSLEEETPEKVYDVLMRIAGEDAPGEMIGEVVGGMVVDNNDFGDATGNQCGESTWAYTVVDEAGDEIEKIHFCDRAYELPTSGIDIDCGSLDSYPSTRIDTFSRVVLHETLHYSTVGPPSLLESQIVDQQNEDGNLAYDPERCFGLNNPDIDNQPGKAEINADNFAWMSIDAWVSRQCSEDEYEWDTFFTEDPPDYRDDA